MTERSPELRVQKGYDMSYRVPTPRADVVCREFDAEIIVLDRRSERVHKLAGDHAAAWRLLSDGGLAGPLPSSFDAAVADLMQLDLVEIPTGFDRRAFMRAGVIGGVGIATVALSELPAFASTNVPTSMSLTAATTNPLPGATDLMTATLTRSAGGSPVSGVTVTFTSGATTLGTATTNGSGVATFTVTAPSAGQQYPVTATFAGNSTYTTSAATLVLYVSQVVPSKTAFTRNGGSSPGQAFTMSGAGFASNSLLTITTAETGGASITSDSGAITTDANGAFASTGFHLIYPNGSGSGSLVVTVTDAAGHKATF
ncbi:MAG: hypothetical protein QOE58_1922, partial [Actinomycetota bacterium]|nr:hypothetical protein [Actinomycetota bacterium]